MHEMKDMVDVVRCHRCEKWRNFAVRKDVTPEDLGLCTRYSIVKDAMGYCDKGKEQEYDE